MQYPYTVQNWRCMHNVLRSNATTKEKADPVSLLKRLTDILEIDGKCECPVEMLKQIGNKVIDGDILVIDTKNQTIATTPQGIDL